jgi:hypothetical protein
MMRRMITSTTFRIGNHWHRKKEFGGLGIPDLGDLNLCLLAAWVQRYYNVEGKIWKDVVDQNIE